MINSPSKPTFRLPVPLFAILVTTLILAGILMSSTIRNLSREQKIMEGFLLDEGLTLIRSFEAGARTTMMHEMMGGNLPIETLVKETAKAERIAYISIITEDGTIVANEGNHSLTKDNALTKKVLKSRKPATTIVNAGSDKPVFEVAAIFQTLSARQPPMMKMMGNRGWNRSSPVTKMLEEGRAVIHLGLCTSEFLAARKQDARHSLFMAGLLFLLAVAGFYFLFLYQGMRITRATLANMRLYTRNIIESMPDGLITFDSMRRVVACNPKALEFTAMDMTTIRGRQIEELFPDWPIESLKDQHEVSPFTCTLTDKQNREIPVEVSGSTLRDHDNRDRGAVFILRDMRKIRAMEEQLSRSQRLAALGRMAAGIAHEIRNPLGTLRGFAQYFGSRADDDASKEYSALMIGEVDRLNESISSLLQFSRPREPKFVRLEPAKLMEKMCKLLEYDLREKKVTLQKNYNCSVRIEADEDMLLQVLLNLLKNAINASHSGETVTLSCNNDSHEISITIADTGIGMSREERERMFDPFFTTRKTGTGLGLAISHQIVEQHRGSFRVDSELDRGTAVTLVLPIQQQR